MKIIYRRDLNQFHWALSPVGYAVRAFIEVSW